MQDDSQTQMPQNYSDLITCAYCGKVGVSSSAEKCPKCGEIPVPIKCEQCGTFAARAKAEYNSTLLQWLCPACSTARKTYQIDQGTGLCSCCGKPITPSCGQYAEHSQHYYSGTCPHCGHPATWFDCDLCRLKKFGKPALSKHYITLKNGYNIHGCPYTRKEEYLALCCSQCAPRFSKWIAERDRSGLYADLSASGCLHLIPGCSPLFILLISILCSVGALCVQLVYVILGQ